LNWLSEQARGAGDKEAALELMRDSLQCATQASWYLLRQLTSLGDDRGDSVREQLDDFARERGITARWYGLGEEPLGGH
jgi:hypothetical protein